MIGDIKLSDKNQPIKKNDAEDKKQNISMQEAVKKIAPLCS